MVSWKTFRPGGGTGAAVYDYGSDQRRLLERVADGGTLWLVTSTRHGRQPRHYHLAYKLVDCDAIDPAASLFSGRYGYVVRARDWRASRHFGFNDATSTLQRLRFTSGRSMAEVTNPGLRLLSIPELSSQDVELLERLQHRIEYGRNVFMSYAHKDAKIPPGGRPPQRPIAAWRFAPWRTGPEWPRHARQPDRAAMAVGLHVRDARGGGRMPGRAAAWLNWAVVPPVVLGYAAYLVLGMTSPTVHGPSDFTPDDAVWVFAQAVMAVVGALIASRRPELPIGWLFCAAGLIGVLEGIAARYAVHELAGTPGSRSGDHAAWLSAALWYPNTALLVLVGLLFPSGRPPSARWWAVGWLLVAGAVLAAASLPLFWRVGGLELLDAIPHNPDAPLATALMNVAALVLAAAGVATAGSLLARLRRAAGIERQQFKWLAYSGSLAAVGLLLFLVPRVVAAGAVPGVLSLVGNVLVAGGVLGIPVAVGIAILRYRLYEIDRIINRTLVYGVLTASLGALYAGVVLGLGQLFGGVGAEPPSWAVAGATLAVAAVFQPARRRLQAVVDRRFNRRRYHAARTIEAFTTRLRQQVDLDSLNAELLAVVEQTMEPTQVSLWLRTPAR